MPEGKPSRYWRQYQTSELYSREVIKVKFESKDCRHCVSQEKYVRNKTGAGRQLLLPSRELYQALNQTRILLRARKENPNTSSAPESKEQSLKRRGSRRRSQYRRWYFYLFDGALATKRLPFLTRF